jgi:hypothetical protein
MSALFVAGLTSNAPGPDFKNTSLLGLAIFGLLYIGFLSILVFQVGALRNQRLRVDASELTVTDAFGRPTRFPRRLLDRVEQYREVTYVWSRFGTTSLLTRIVCTDGRGSIGFRLSVPRASRFADFLGVRFVPASSIWKALIGG